MSRIICFIVLLVASMSCNLQYDARPRNPSWGFFTTKMNGQEWNKTYRNGYQVVQGLTASGAAGSAMPCKREYYIINAELYTSEGYIRQNLYLKKVPIVKGKYKVIPYIMDHCNESDPVYGILYTWIDDGCVIGDEYKILESENNFLQIESYNEKSKEIKGTFQLTFVLEREGSDHTLPDTLRFREGKFHTKIMDLRRK
ncbi:hypothetical protein [Dyadobacter sp. CY323]|uniref:hypothetical protein n=1 Tax=Dyadobacter sp. CY323 TaxID=2907302 RepID=UPI001F2C7205|nr:hypothetical protein [Dyadobacter sp. CY323]MCE6990616.1 hypothetical protein [Dyadobacter sp. CY323]